MKILSVYDLEFRPYGAVLEPCDTAPLLAAMAESVMPASGTEYQASIPALEETDLFAQLGEDFFGGMPIQIGMCWGENTALNALEYHRNSELNIGDRDFVLLLAKQWEIEDGQLDTAQVVAFRVPAGVAVELYGTTLHYAPCGHGFRVAVVLPKGTNADLNTGAVGGLLRARNKWLLAHPESSEADGGAYVGLRGENIDLKDLC